MTGHVLGGGLGDDGAGGLAVDRVEHQHLGAVGEGGLGLAQLLGRVLVGVGVEHLAVGAELLDLGLEQRAVLGLVAGGLGLGQQERDLAALAAAAAAADGRRSPPSSSSLPQPTMQPAPATASTASAWHSEVRSACLSPFVRAPARRAGTHV